MKDQFGMNEMRRCLVIEKLIDGSLSVSEAASQLDLSYRQALRLKKKYLSVGPKSVLHGNKGKVPVNKIKCRDKIIEVFLDWKRRTDEGVNASHLCDILERDHGIKVCRQTTWRLLKSNGLQIRTRRVRKYRKRRERREKMGDILYLDGSPHRWFGEQHEKATLVLCTDDATTQALWAVFVPEENRNACFEVAYEVFTRFGIPMNFWLDRASQFITTRGEGVRNPQSELPTHWQNAMYNLGVRNIFAHSPQARGRGERANGTFQDRLCAELQYRKISDLKEATKFVNEVFIPEYNHRFSVEPKCKEGIWRNVPEEIDLRFILSARTDRRVQNDNTVKHHGRRFQILKQPGKRTWAGLTIEVQEWFDGSIHLVSKGMAEIAYVEIKSEPRYNRIEGLKKNTLISDLHRHTYF